MQIMKIAMIGHKRVPSREGGIEIVVGQLAARMVQAGHVVDVYNRKGHHVSGEENDAYLKRGLKEYKGIHIITIPTFQNKKLNAVVYSFLATMRALFGRYDVIHYHAEGACSMLWIPHLFGIRTIATIHGLDWQRSKWGGFATKFLLFGEKVAAKYADEIIVLSKNMQKYFKDTYRRDTVFIPNGVLKPRIHSDRIIKKKWGLEKDSYILFLARIVPEKGLHYLLDAYMDIDTGKRLVIAGGSSHTDNYMKQMEKKAAKDKRILMAGFVQGELLEELYSNAYIYVLPSDVEGMPVSLLEAMSYGNCCLVSDIAENVEVVEMQIRAACFKKSSVPDLKHKLRELLGHKEIVDRYKAGAQNYICGKYNWDDVTYRTLEVYKG